MTHYRKTNNLTAGFRTEAELRNVIEEQGKALRKLNDRIRVKTSEISGLNTELGHLRRTIKGLELVIRELKNGDTKNESNRFVK